MKTLYSEISSTFDAMLRCKQTPDTHAGWAAKHRHKIESLTKEYMPSGSGIDCGTKFDFDESKPDKLVFTFSYHHMNDGGMYDGWTEHKLIVTPSLGSGRNLKITGRDRNQVKDYLYDVYSDAVDTAIE